MWWLARGLWVAAIVANLIALAVDPISWWGLVNVGIIVFALYCIFVGIPRMRDRRILMEATFDYLKEEYKRLSGEDWKP